MPNVIGIAVLGGEVASVVCDDKGVSLATHVVDADDYSAASIVGSVIELVSSAPVAVSKIGLVAPSAQVDELKAALTPASDLPGWFSQISVDTVESALVELTHADATLTEGSLGTITGRRGNSSKLVAVVNLDEYTAPTAGVPIVIVDTQADTITGRASLSPCNEQHTAVLDPIGAVTVASTIASISGSESISHVVVTGVGAEVHGVPEAFERALGRPIVIAKRPQFAIAAAAASLAWHTRPPYGAVSESFATQDASSSGHSLSRETAPNKDLLHRVDVLPADQSVSASYKPDCYNTGQDMIDVSALSLDEDCATLPSSNMRTRRRWWLIGGTTLVGFVILASAIAVALLSAGTAQRVVGVTTVSVTTQTTILTSTETVHKNTVRTTTVTPPTHTKTVTKTVTQPLTTVTSTETITEAGTKQNHWGADQRESGN